MQSYRSSFASYRNVNGKEDHVEGLNDNGHIVVQGRVNEVPFRYTNRRRLPMRPRLPMRRRNSRLERKGSFRRQTGDYTRRYGGRRRRGSMRKRRR